MQRPVASNRLMVMADEKEIFDITSAPKALTADQASRQKRYLISMMIRTACFILAIALPSPFRWVALAGAVALPYFAVVIANAGRGTFSPGANIRDENPRPLN